MRPWPKQLPAGEWLRQRHMEFVEARFNKSFNIRLEQSTR